MPSCAVPTAADWLALSLVPRLGPRRLRQLVLSGEPWSERLSASQQHYLEYLRRGAGREAVLQPWLSWCEATDPDGAARTLLHPGHPAWPALLDHIEDPPPVLWAWGALSALEGPMLAIVGTRHPTPLGQAQAVRFSTAFAQAGIGVISGMAMGIDGCAHLGTLNAGGVTVGVLGGGIDVLYPRRHAQLRARLLANGGLLLSEHPPGTEVRPAHFPRRNRIITGLAQGIVIIEAAQQSGSLVSARLALEQNREVFALPGAVDNPQAAGCHALIQQGAMLVTSPDEPIRELALTLATAALPSSNADLVPDAGLLAHLSSEPQSLDALMVRTQMNLADTMAALLALEMDGKAVSVTGGWRLYCADAVSP